MFHSMREMQSMHNLAGWYVERIFYEMIAKKKTWQTSMALSLRVPRTKALREMRKCSRKMTNWKTKTKRTTKIKKTEAQWRFKTNRGGGGGVCSATFEPGRNFKFTRRVPGRRKCWIRLHDFRWDKQIKLPNIEHPLPRRSTFAISKTFSSKKLNGSESQKRKEE
ncbi:hypothetical protein N431DRAFT_527513, partial [Stipitochalara longipes BDJ]